MSDRARSSVRTESREGSGTADEVPAGAAPVDGRTESVSTSANGAGRPAGGATAAPGEPAAAAPADGAQRGSTPAAASAPAPAAEPAGAAPAKAVAASGQADAAPAKAAGRAAAPARAAQPAPVDEAARPVTSPAPPVPPATGTNRAVGAARTAAPRSGVPAAGSVPIDSTQAVTLPPGGARPTESARPADQQRSAASRPAAGRPAADGAASAAAGRSKGKPGRGPRRARLQLRHIDTWSALKISLVLSIALFFVWMVAVGILYGVLGQLGVFDSVNDLIGQVSSSTGEESGSSDVITAGVVFGGAAVIGAINILLLTALCTVGTFVYNLCSDLVGGLEVTLAERD